MIPPGGRISIIEVICDEISRRINYCQFAVKLFIVDFRHLYVIKYLIKGTVLDANGKPLGDLHLQAMDSDQGFFEDHNDDLLGSSNTTSDGSFEIAFDDSTFNDSWLEKSPEIYIVVRNEDGQILHRTEKIEVKGDEKTNDTVNIPMKISIDSKEKKTELPASDLYWNNQRILSAFSSVGDTITLNNSEFERNFRLLLSSINAWLIYTNEATWKRIDYDGPQVPRYPWQVPNHGHKLKWEQGK
jgi:hypothetical protein